MPVLPPVLAWMIGSIGAALVAKVIAREWRRVNEELHRAGAQAKTAAADRERMPRLRRDPETGVYRPHR